MVSFIFILFFFIFLWKLFSFKFVVLSAQDESYSFCVVVCRDHVSYDDFLNFSLISAWIFGWGLTNYCPHLSYYLSRRDKSVTKILNKNKNYFKLVINKKAEDNVFLKIFLFGFVELFFKLLHLHFHHF